MGVEYQNKNGITGDRRREEKRTLIDKWKYRRREREKEKEIRKERTKEEVVT